MVEPRQHQQLLDHHAVEAARDLGEKCAVTVGQPLPFELVARLVDRNHPPDGALHGVGVSHSSEDDYRSTDKKASSLFTEAF